MAFDNKPSITTGTYSDSSPGGIIQSPEISSHGEPEERSIKDACMGREVVKVVIAAGRNRSIVGSRILAKYNAERPYDSGKLESEGLGWKQNFTTKPMPSMIEKVAPRFTQAVDGLKYLTSSSLSNKYENNTEKTEKFRQKITETIRARKGWTTLVDDIAFNNSLFGYSAVAWLDEFTWFPTHFKFDEAFAPDGTKQDATFAQVMVLKETLLPHELFAKIKDRDSAKSAGYNIKETTEVINLASSLQLRETLGVGGTLEFWYQNAIRELTVGASYMAGASVVVVYHLLAREVTGKVSHYQFAGEGLKAIFSKDDRFDGMDECLCFFTYQKGNGTLHGSKGVGRDIYELAGMIDRTRNEIVDRAIMSGKIPIQGDIKRIHTFKMSVVGMTCIFPTGWTILEQRLDGNIEPFLKLDAYFSSLVDQLIGNTSPPQMAGGEAFRSPAAWNLLAAREEEGKDSRITRFMVQFVNMIQTMQRRICDSDTVEDDAKAAQKDLLEVMTRKELDELANHPVAGTIRDLTPMERQMIAMVVSEKKGNPLYNQLALEKEDLSARVGADFATRVLLTENDPTQEVENTRAQQIESSILTTGVPVPVSPRDAHLIHLSALMPLAEQAGGAVMQGQAPTAVLEAIVAHASEHVARAVEQGAPKDKLKPIQAFLKQAGPALAELKKLDTQASAVAQESAGLDQESELISAQTPPPDGQQPPGP